MPLQASIFAMLINCQSQTFKPKINQSKIKLCLNKKSLSSRFLRKKEIFALIRVLLALGLGEEVDKNPAVNQKLSLDKKHPNASRLNYLNDFFLAASAFFLRLTEGFS